MTHIAPISAATPLRTPPVSPQSGPELEIDPSTLQRREPSPADRARVEASIDTARSFFREHGIADAEGNGPIEVSFVDEDNAAYMPKILGLVGDQFFVGIDPVTGKSLGDANDIVFHEYTHRIVSHLAPKIGFHGEAGAVQEALADTLASAIDDDNWVLGEDYQPGGLRSMEHPGDERYAVDLSDVGHVRIPEHVKDFVKTRDDRGGSHVNLGIPDKAAYLIGTAIGRDKMADIYLNAIRSHMHPATTIAGLADSTIRSATELYSSGPEVQAVRDAWNAVGLTQDMIDRRGVSAKENLLQKLARNAGLWASAEAGAPAVRR